MLKNLGVWGFKPQRGPGAEPLACFRRLLDPDTDARGFTLLETLVALAIVAIGFAFAFAALPAGLGALDHAKNLDAAASLAQSLLDMAGQAPAQGEESGFAWRIDTSPLGNAGAVAALRGQMVQVSVTWQEDGQNRSFGLHSLRLGR